MEGTEKKRPILSIYEEKRGSYVQKRLESAVILTENAQTLVGTFRFYSRQSIVRIFRKRQERRDAQYSICFEDGVGNDIKS